MSRKDFHNSSFDEGTLIKLHVFKEYLKAWLPVFIKIKEPWWKKIFIYDFFAGEGTDVDGNFGSPLIIIDELKVFCKDIKIKNLELKVVFNEFINKKKEKLSVQSDKYLRECKVSENASEYCPNFNSDDGCVFQLKVENKDFKEFFDDIYSYMVSNPKIPQFMFLDQFGVKFITQEVFKNIVALERTDFIFFISSSYAKRFVDVPEFKRYLDITKDVFDDTKPYHCHRVIFNYYKSQLPANKEFYLAPFSIKKGTNIYGLIFGTNHKLGIEKFLKICWKINPVTGDANFDIDNERINPDEPKLFAQFDIPNKIQFFQTELEKQILSGALKSINALYSFTFDMGCLPKHANHVINELVKIGNIQPLTTSTENIHKLQEQAIIRNIKQ